MSSSPHYPQSQIFSRRALLLMGMKASLLTGLVGRLIYLQVLESDRYQLLADENRINLRLLPPVRAKILDRNGLELAKNRPTYRAILTPEETGELDLVLNRVRSLVSLEGWRLERIQRRIASQPRFVPVELRDNLNWEEVSRLEAHTFDLPGIRIDTGQVRIYPQKESFAHSVGYVSSPSKDEVGENRLFALPGFKVGKRGIEKQYDEQLRGKGGTRRIEVNASGRIIKEVEHTPPLPGNDLWLSSDERIQKFTLKLLSKQRRASAVVMHIHSGEILAMVSVPSFDPNLFPSGIDEKSWQKIASHEDHPLTNRAVSGLYAPGSTFKLAVLAAALEEGMPPETQYFCSGKLRFGRRNFHCWKRGGHGDVDMAGALRESCDVWFYNAGQLLGVDSIAKYSRFLGLGENNSVDISEEKPGILPTKSWKLKKYDKAWLKSETLITSIGQGYNLFTPLQLATMMARIANGGYAVRPRVSIIDEKSASAIAAGQSPFERLPFRAETLDLLKQYSWQAVNETTGTAYHSRLSNPLYHMGGKTGTSQVRNISSQERNLGVLRNEDVEWERRDHSLFVGFAPTYAPSFAVSVVCEHAGSGARVAAPIARDLLHFTQKLYPSERSL